MKGCNMSRKRKRLTIEQERKLFEDIEKQLEALPEKHGLHPDPNILRRYEMTRLVLDSLDHRLALQYCPPATLDGYRRVVAKLKEHKKNRRTFFEIHSDIAARREALRPLTLRALKNLSKDEADAIRDYDRTREQQLEIARRENADNTAFLMAVLDETQSAEWLRHWVIPLLNAIGFEAMDGHDKLLLAALVASESDTGSKKQKWSLRDIGTLFGMSAGEVGRRKTRLCEHPAVKSFLASVRDNRRGWTKGKKRDAFLKPSNWRTRAAEYNAPLLERTGPKTPAEETELEELKDMAQAIVESLEKGSVSNARYHAKRLLDETD